jgi:hypothetical protein
VPRLKISRAIPPLLLFAFIAGNKANFILTFLGDEETARRRSIPVIQKITFKGSKERPCSSEVPSLPV